MELNTEIVTDTRPAATVILQHDHKYLTATPMFYLGEARSATSLSP